VGIQATADGLGGLGNVFEVGAAIRQGGRAHGDEDHVGVGDIGFVVIAGEVQVVGCQAQHGIQMRLVHGCAAALEQGNFLLVDV